MAELDTKQLLRDVLDEKLAPLHVDKQRHYADHLKMKDLEMGDIVFIKESRKFVVSLKDSFWKTLVRVIVVTGLCVITGGIYAYVRYHGKSPH